MIFHLEKLAHIKRIVLTGLLASTFLLVGCGEQTNTQTDTPVIQPALIEVVSPQRASDLVFNGVVRASQRADLAFRIGGLLTEIKVDEGDSVKKGQLLATLDDRDAINTLASAQLELQNTEQEYQRSKAIFDKTQAISKSELDAMTTRYNLAKNRVEDAKRKVEYTQLFAPFDGVIGDKKIENYGQIQANQPLLTLQDVTDLEVVIDIPDKVMLSGVRNTKAIAELPAIQDQQFDLALRTYSTQANTDSQTYSVVLGFDDLKGYRVLPGMSVRVFPAKDDHNTSQNLITLPLTAIVPDNQGKQFVWVVNSDNKVEKRYVEVGTVYKDRIVIKNNLEQGEKVIIAGVLSAKEGMEVRPYSEENGA
ncbi:efflux RND transporter periplasmic adaptor subunit [Vibrio sp. ES.051]|uniref:efflux RND transporter periplasmic adaptor subunit n=1 Tax=Vibrio sp. ES.051 TaxID=1761909 RepID=UPI000BF3431D|nr:efflux RND transporter periplasmic adaptor subunit [Vibrio sp. ES.051]